MVPFFCLWISVCPDLKTKWCLSTDSPFYKRSALGKVVVQDLENPMPVWQFYPLHKNRAKELYFSIFLAIVKPHIQPSTDSASQRKSLEGKCSIWSLVKCKSPNCTWIFWQKLDLKEPQKHFTFFWKWKEIFLSPPPNFPLVLFSSLFSSSIPFLFSPFLQFLLSSFCKVTTYDMLMNCR